jgi:hypothetical protein
MGMLAMQSQAVATRLFHVRLLFTITECPCRTNWPSVCDPTQAAPSTTKTFIVKPCLIAIKSFLLAKRVLRAA